jgi:hypothetical protein
LHLLSGVTLTHNATASGTLKPIILASGANYTTTVYTVLQLIHRDGKWYEVTTTKESQATSSNPIRIIFYDTDQIAPVLLSTTESKTITKFESVSIDAISYSTNGVDFTTVSTNITVSVTVSANTELILQVDSFKTGYTQGCLMFNV